MKLYNKYLAVALLASGALFTACSDDNDYVPGTNPDGPQVFVPTTESTTFEVDVDVTNYSLTIQRQVTTEAITVPIQVSPLSDDTPYGVFNFPASVSFAAGEATASYEFTVDAASLEYDEEWQFEFKIDDGYSTPYGPSTVVLTIVLPAPWDLLGTGEYYDEYWGVNDDEATYGGPREVTVWQDKLDPYHFRVSNPYVAWNGEDTYFDFYQTQAGHSYFGQPVDRNDLIVYNDFFCEYNPNYDDDVYLVFPGRFNSYTDPKTWVYNRVVDFQDNGLPGEIHLSPFYYMFNNGGWDKSSAEPITIIFPGYEAIDTKITVEYEGVITLADESLEVMANIELGADASEAKIALIEGTTVTSEVLEAIDNGTIASKSINSTGQVRLPFAPQASGKFTVVGVSYYEDEQRAYDYATFSYTYGAPETWNFVTTGLYTYLEFWEENLGLEPEMLDMYESSTTPGRYKIEYWMGGEDFYFTVDSNNSIYVDEEQPTGVTSGGAEIWVDDFTLWGTGAEGELDDGVYYFAVIYYNSQSGGYYAYGYESFEPAAAGASVKTAKGIAKKNFSKAQTSKFMTVPARKAKYIKKSSLVRPSLTQEKLRSK